MKNRGFYLVLLTIYILILCATYCYQHSTKITLANLPPLQVYRADLYLKEVQHLQALGQTAACNQLLAITKNDNFLQSHEEQIEILCRMLFTNRDGQEFRESYHGMPKWLGGTSQKDWPLSPIEIVDGVPFAITRVYGPYYGTDDNYVKYCMANCDWSKYKFTSKTEQEKNVALIKLLSSTKWKMPLNQDERNWFSSQIQ
jgi:hypothetical protein